MKDLDWFGLVLFCVKDVEIKDLELSNDFTMAELWRREYISGVCSMSLVRKRGSL
jgi:hypothetical protein